MPRGDNPKSREALEKNRHKYSSETALKAKKKSDESKRASASLTESLKKQLTPDLTDEIALMLIKRAKQGNLKAYELLRDQMGEKPTEKIAVATVNEEAISKLQKAIEKRRKDETITE